LIIFNNIAIVGPGLIGGSIGLAVKANGLCSKVIGIGRRKSSLDKAIQKSAIDKATLSMSQGVQDADLIIISTSVRQVKEKIQEAALLAKKGAVIMDVNSTKQDIVNTAHKAMPYGVYFVGTHPIAGSENSGIASGSSKLFDNTVCIITPVKGTQKPALDKINLLWKSIGAETVFVSPKAHDDMVSRISHLPHCLAYALCNTVSKKDLKFSGSGFRDTTRIAKSSPEMWSDIFLNNSKSLLRAIGDFEKNIKRFKRYVVSKDKANLEKRLKDAMRKRQSID